MTKMPRTKSTRTDKRTPQEKLDEMLSPVDRLIFFNYFDGINSNGMYGFSITEKPGSVKHKRTLNCLDTMTPNKFRSKAKRMALLAQQFVDRDIVPDESLRVALHEPSEMEAIMAEMTPPVDEDPICEALDKITDKVELFIFYRYYEGFASNGEFGFAPRHGAPGCVYHKRTYTKMFEDLSDAQFREKGRRLGELAYKFFTNNLAPPPEEPVCIATENPPQLVAAAAYAGYNM